MTFRPLAVAAALVLPVLGALAPPGPAAAAPAARPAAASGAKADTAVFAGGCFWSLELQFEGVPGVRSVVSGYTGGHKARPTYEEVSSHTTGHLEAVRIVFDPSVTSYEALLHRFWHGIDPTQGDGQFCDLGESYRTAIFVRGEAQRRAARASLAALERSGELKARIVTEIRPASVFWPAEDYHQDFGFRNPDRYRRYRQGCGRDRSLARVWGDKAVLPLAH